MQLFADLLQHTLQRRKQFHSIPKPLKNHNIQYQWFNPTKLLIMYSGTKHVVFSLQEGSWFLHSWGILEVSHVAAQANQSSSDKTLN